jgi:hypothetical protein
MLKNSTIRQITIIGTLVLMITVNILANALPINGLDTGEISDNFNVFFVPAGYVFSIWGLIYLALAAFAVYQALPSQRDNPRIASAALPIVIGNLANTGWIFAWHYEQFALSMLIMIVLLITLIWTYVSLGVNQKRVSTAEFWAVQVPFSIYLGWITVATIANATALLDYINWGAWGIAPQTWTAIMLAVASVVATAMAVTRRDAAYLAVLVWAFAGIAVKFPNEALVNTSAWIATGYSVVLILATFFMRQQGQKARMVSQSSTF